MVKFRLYFDKDLETDWLNKMAEKGYAFKKFCIGFYAFEKSEPGEYIYQVDLLQSWIGDKEDFASFMEDSGVEVISQWYRWVFIRKKASEGPFELYTDTESKIEQYSRIRRMFMVVLVIEAICFLIDFQVAIQSIVPSTWWTAILLGVIVLAFLKMVWKCSWKIEELKREKK